MIWKVYNKDGIERCEIHKLEYSGTFMGEKFITASIRSPHPIEFAIGDYVIYRGEQFTLNYDPSIIKKASLNSLKDAFVYENVKFNSYSDELVRCEFLDYVLNDNLIHFSSLPSFGFHALTIHDLADRIKANLDRVYTGDRAWTVTVNDSNITVNNVFITADRLNVWGALSLVSTIFKSNFIIRGRTITIGTAGNVISDVFEYGKGKGLNKITRIADSEQQIITRLRVYGSTRNLPLRYYNKLTNPSSEPYLPDNMAVQNLMLPSFPYETLDPYLDSPNIEVLGVMEGSVFFDGSDESLPEIYPSLEGMTAAQLEAAGIHVYLDPGDNGNLDEVVSDATNIDGTPITDNGVFEDEEVPQFKLVIKDIGFDLSDYLLETPVIAMKTGMNAGREFEIQSCVKEGNKYVLTCNRVSDVDRYFPYGTMNIKAGDKFVLLNIEMPEVYIQAASQRLLEAGQEYLSKNDYVRYTYSVDISPVYMARNPNLHDTIVEGDYLQFSDTDLGIAGSIIIDNLRIKEGDEIIPIYEVTLTEEKQVGTIQKIQNQINYLLSGAGGSILDVKQTESLIRLIGDRQFLSKVSEDTAQKLIKFLEGIEVGTFASGLLGSGAAIKNVNGTSVAEVDQLLVRQRAEFFSVLIHEARSVGGQLIISAANMLCTKVEETPNFYRCYFDSKDGEVANLFSTSDFARCQIFTGTRQKFYWRKVVAVGTDYIELSKTDAAINSDIPEVGDTIFQLGSTDVNRQGAMILSTVGNDAPSFIQYSGINSYDLTGKETTKFTRLGNRIAGNTVFTSEGQNLDEWGGIIEDSIQATNDRIDNQKIGATNLLLNTGFLGDFNSLNVNPITTLLSGNELNTNPLVHWVHSDTTVIDAPSRSGKGVKIGSISQTVNLKANEPYTLSFKAKGNSLTVTLTNSKSISLTEEYRLYTITYILTETKAYTFTMSGDASVYEIKLENGNVRTDYSYAQQDDIKAISQLQAINMITDVIKNYDTDILGGLILTSMLQLGKYKDGVMERVNAGISGIYNNDDDPAIWAGGSFDDAIRTVQKFIDNPNYEPTEAEWAEMANIVFTHGGDGFFRGYVYALGGFFRGKVESNFEGNRIVIDPKDRSLKMYNVDGQLTLSLLFKEEYNYAELKLYSFKENGEVLYSAQINSNEIYLFRDEYVNGVYKTDSASIFLGGLELVGTDRVGTEATEIYRFSVENRPAEEGQLRIQSKGLPTSDEGLSPGMWYIDNGTLKIKT